MNRTQCKWIKRVLVVSLNAMRRWLNSDEATERDRSQLQAWSIAVATHPLLLPCLSSLS